MQAKALVTTSGKDGKGPTHLVLDVRRGIVVPRSGWSTAVFMVPRGVLCAVRALCIKFVQNHAL